MLECAAHGEPFDGVSDLKLLDLATAVEWGWASPFVRPGRYRATAGSVW